MCLSVSLSLCVFVCVSVTLRYRIKTAKRNILQLIPHNSAGTLVPGAKDHSEIRTRIRATITVGWVKIGHFRQRTHYNSKTVQDRCIIFIKVEKKSYAL